MGCMQEAFDLFKKCPRCGEPVKQINIYPFLTLEDWAGYYCSKCKTWVDAFITPEKPSEIFNTTGYEALPRILKRYERHVTKNASPPAPNVKKEDDLMKCPKDCPKNGNCQHQKLGYDYCALYPSIKKAGKRLHVVLDEKDKEIIGLQAENEQLKSRPTILEFKTRLDEKDDEIARLTKERDLFAKRLCEGCIFNHTHEYKVGACKAYPDQLGRCLLRIPADTSPPAHRPACPPCSHQLGDDACCGCKNDPLNEKPAPNDDKPTSIRMKETCVNTNRCDYNHDCDVACYTEPETPAPKPSPVKASRQSVQLGEKTGAAEGQTGSTPVDGGNAGDKCNACGHWWRGVGCMIEGPVGTLVECSEVNPKAKTSLFVVKRGKHALEYLGFKKLKMGKK